MKLLITLTLLAAILNQTIGVKLYNFKKEDCCGGVVSDMELDENGYRVYKGCCGGTWYDYNKFICCGSTLMELKSLPYSTTGCCQTISEDGKAVDIFYDYSTHTCCDGIVREKENKVISYGCCGSTPYDYSTEDCLAGGYVTPRKTLNANEAYCGPETFNYNTHLCCSQDVEVGDGEWTVQFGILAKDDRKTCCGKDQLYDFTTEVCCGGNVFPKQDGPSDCCAGQLYDNTQLMCCGRNLYPISDDQMCCWATGTLYNPSTELCCYVDGVVSLDGNCPSSTACCEDWTTA